MSLGLIRTAYVHLVQGIRRHWSRDFTAHTPLKTRKVTKLSLLLIMHHTTRNVGEWRLLHVFLISATHGEEQFVYLSITPFFFLLTCISVYSSQYLTNLMHKICFTVSFISCLYMFRAHVLIIRRSKFHYTASGIITPVGVMIPGQQKKNGVILR